MGDLIMLFESTGEIRVPIIGEYYLTGSLTNDTTRIVLESYRGQLSTPRVILHPVESPSPAGSLEPEK